MDRAKGRGNVDWEPEKSLRKIIGDVLGVRAENGQMHPLNVLDSAYYEAAKGCLHEAGSIYEKLELSEFGRRFLLTAEEETDFLKLGNDFSTLD